MSLARDGVEVVTGSALSGKGGAGKSFLQFQLAAQASADEIPTLVPDLDPEANMTRRFALHNEALPTAPGMSDVLLAAGVLNGGEDGFDIAAGAAKLREVIQPTGLPHIDCIPAGRQLQKLSQVTLEGGEWFWLLRDIFRAAELPHQLWLPDTGGRRGWIVTMVMYAADVAYSPITSMSDAVTKAVEARARVNAIQDAHPLRWAGPILTGVDTSRNAAMNILIRTDAADAFSGEVDDKGQIVKWGEIIAEIPYRPATFHQSYELCERLADYAGAQARDGVTLMRRILANLFDVAGAHTLREHVLERSRPASNAKVSA